MEREWLIRICVSFALVLLLPFEFSMSSTRFVYASPIVQIGQASIVPEIPGFVRILGIPVLFIAYLPSIGFNYVLFTRPRGESLKKLLALAVFFSQPISLYLFILPMTSFPVIPELTLILFPAILSVNWAFLILIVVPFIQREVNPENKSSSNTACDYFFNIIRKPSKLDVISLFLGLCIMFIPLMVIEQSYWLYYDQYNPSNLEYISASGMLTVFTAQSLDFQFSTFSALQYGSILLTTVLHVRYIQSVLGYLQGRIIRTKCVIDGIAAALSSIIIPYIPLPFFGMFGVNIIPIPAIFIIGLFLIFLLKPTVTEEKIWEDTPHHMWFEKPITHKGSQANDEIKVPFHYVIRSKLSRSKRQEDHYDWDDKGEDVFTQSDPKED
ncbi:MAG: hypothetical protein P1Q69_01060 [Candidatus Thorarchaeota archaeon]|nr:hypothetical protein [Candidatus Thorarchaeota archaeon]